MAAASSYAMKGEDTPNAQFVNIVANISQAMQKMKAVFVQQMQVIENTLELLVTSGDDVRMKTNFSTGLKSPGLSDKDLHPCCDKVLNKLSVLEDIVQKLCDSFCTNLKTSDKASSNSVKPSKPTVLVTETRPTTVEAQVSLDSSFQVITLNSAEDYPGGSWLGNEDVAEAKVRVPIAPITLSHINAYCLTPEKMAITLLDYLFPREILAVSNLSGKGKHGKKQLDPLMVMPFQSRTLDIVIYAIRCHLIHKFHITEKDWYRIKQNMDSKCRTTWRKKMRGQPLGGKKLPIQPNHSPTVINSNSNSSSGNKSLNSKSELLSNIDPMPPFIREDFEDVETGLIRAVGGEYKVVRATPEQLEKFHSTHTVLEVFAEDDQGPLLSEDDTSMTLDDHSETSLVTGDGEEVSVLTVDANLQESEFIDCD